MHCDVPSAGAVVFLVGEMVCADTLDAGHWTLNAYHFQGLPRVQNDPPIMSMFQVVRLLF